VSDSAAVDVSVVIVTFNNEGVIGACLETLARDLGSKRAQIHVIDNGSEDGTVDVVAHAAQRLKSSARTVTLTQNAVNVGFTRALNQGLRAANGEHILILNPDTRVQPGCMDALLDALSGSDDIGVVAPQLLNVDGSIQASCRRFPQRWNLIFEFTGLSRLFPFNDRLNYWKMGDFDHRTARIVEQPQGACLLTRRDVLARVGLWDEVFPMFFSDVDWCKRVYDCGFKILFEPRAKVVHARGASVLRNRAKMIWSSHRSFYTYFKKHGKSNWTNHVVGGLLLSAALLRIAWALSVGRWRHKNH